MLRDALTARWFQVILVISVFLLAAPFILSAMQRARGELSTPEEWFAGQAHNHGPWRELDSGFLVYQPFLLLIPATLLTAIYLAVSRRSASSILGGILLVSFQTVALWSHLQFLFWLVD